ncbi:MAG: hypothetical protein GX452_04555 [Ignavibacteriales bacterium]|jgi:hypothetical protein|nr:hypothetical protein [Ignavibacteriaceae bacterium]NLH60654.1 hypothetical protein [Ignavibacteriales bacterium]HOJ18408.1 hypothetical protein [Ignavibacteriaceae bacterium]HPO57085.1 hypothetical protein [Ignavibacteriaceae bacterium]
MDDTVKEAAAVYSEMIAGLTGEERLILALKSFSAAKELILANLAETCDEKAKRILLLKRLYGDEFTDEQIKIIAEKD